MESIRGYTRYDPEYNFIPSGVALAKFTLYDTTDGEYKAKSRVVAWDTLGENAYNKLAINDLLFVKGYYKERSWTNKDGKPVITKEFIAKDIWVIENDDYIDINKDGYRDDWTKR